MESESEDELRTHRVLPAAIIEAKPGRRVGRFTLQRKLGEGGQGQAWLATDPHRATDDHEGLVVLKFLPQDVRCDKDRINEFRAAYLAAQALHHEALCPLYDLEQDPAVGVFQVMQYQPGVTLRQLLRESAVTGQGLDAETVLELLERVARALDCVHVEDVVHGDVKPENLIWDSIRRRIHLIDFGLAVRAPKRRGPMADGLSAAGTPRYLSPELWQGWQPHPADDRWALAVTAWELLTGTPPFPGSGKALQDRISAAELSRNDSISPSCLRVFAQAFSSDPDSRHDKCLTFVHALRAALETNANSTSAVSSSTMGFPAGATEAVCARDACARQWQLPQFIEFAWGRLCLIPSGWCLCGNRSAPDDTLRKLREFGADARMLRYEQPAVWQQIQRPFFIGMTPVTIRQFSQFTAETGYRSEAEQDGAGGWGYDARQKTFTGPSPQFTWRETGWSQSPQHPVVNVSWNDARAFAEACNRFRSVIPGRRLRFRLPTETEWEYACRAGSEHDYWFGAGHAELGRYGNVTDATKRRVWPHWKGLESESGILFTCPVEQFPSNPFGLHDLHGNVRQWCADSAVAADSSCYAGLQCRVIRGGAWCNSPLHARSSARDLRPESHRDDHIGIRIVADILDQITMK